MIARWLITPDWVTINWTYWMLKLIKSLRLLTAHSKWVKAVNQQHSPVLLVATIDTWTHQAQPNLEEINKTSLLLLAISLRTLQLHHHQHQDFLLNNHWTWTQKQISQLRAYQKLERLISSVLKHSHRKLTVKQCQDSAYLILATERSMREWSQVKEATGVTTHQWRSMKLLSID